MNELTTQTLEAEIDRWRNLDREAMRRSMMPMDPCEVVIVCHPSEVDMWQRWFKRMEIE